MTDDTRKYPGTPSSSSASSSSSSSDSSEKKPSWSSALPGEKCSALPGEKCSALTGEKCSALPGEKCSALTEGECHTLTGDETHTTGGNGKGWNYRGYLPHFDCYNVLQSITFRLPDSLPHGVLAQLEQEIVSLTRKERDTQRRIGIEKWIDAGYGCCALSHPKMAEVMQNALLHHDGKRYELLAWCIMPNHVHVLINPIYPLGKIVQSWKSFTGRFARQRNAELALGVPEGVTASFWMKDYWDRYIRDEAHLASVIEYIHYNPVKAGLCDSAELWQWSSAFLGAPRLVSAKSDSSEKKPSWSSALPEENR